MPNYLINSNEDSGGRNEVHTTACDHLPAYSNRVSLGYFEDEIIAVRYAKNIGWSHADGCYYCCPKEHHG